MSCIFEFTVSHPVFAEGLVAFETIFVFITSVCVALEMVNADYWLLRELLTNFEFLYLFGNVLVLFVAFLSTDLALPTSYFTTTFPAWGDITGSRHSLFVYERVLYRFWGMFAFTFCLAQDIFPALGRYKF
jgi:hypothetical protein